MADLLNTNIGPERVQVFPVPLGTVQVPGVTTDVLGVVISSTLSTAPVNTPVQVNDLATFVSTFGNFTEVNNNAYYAMEGYFNNAGSGATAWVVNAGSGTQQVSTVTPVADTSGSLAGTNWLLNSANNADLYYVWYQVSGTGSDPTVAGRIGIKVAIATNATADQVASATASAINALEDFSAVANSGVVTITDTLSGPATTPTDGTPTTGFAFAITTPGADLLATDYIGNVTAGSGLRAFDSIDTLGLLCVPGLPLSLAYLVQPAVIDYALVTRSDFGATFSTTFSLTSVPVEIKKSNTDVTVGPTLTVNLVTGNTITFTGSPDLSKVTPGMLLKKGATVIGTVITGVDNTAHTITTESVPSTVATDVLQAYMPSAVSYKELIVNTPSRTNSWYFNWVNMLDESGKTTANTLVAVDPVCHVAGVMARIDANVGIGGVSHAAAGLQFAGIAGIQGLVLTLSERNDAAPLRLNFINRITSFPGAGNVIFGAYTSDSGTSPSFTSDDQLSQVIRTVQFIKASLEPGLRSFIWENFSPVTQARVATAITNFMRNNIYLFPAGLPESQQFKVISVTPTTSELGEGLLKVRVQVRPNEAVRFIEVDLEYPLPSA